MNTEINPEKYVEIVNKANEEALTAAIELLKNVEGNKYIAFEDFEDAFPATSTNEIPIGVFGVGLGEDGDICVNAMVENQGYGFAEEDFPQDWVSISELKADCYPYLYQFVAKNIDRTISKEEADSVAQFYWE